MTRRTHTEPKTELDPVDPETENLETVDTEVELESNAVSDDGSFLPIDTTGDWCPNCNSRLRYDYIGNKTICPIADVRCPQHIHEEV